jgi:hypothetical protein
MFRASSNGPAQKLMVGGALSLSTVVGPFEERQNTNTSLTVKKFL